MLTALLEDSCAMGAQAVAEKRAALSEKPHVVPYKRANEVAAVPPDGPPASLAWHPIAIATVLLLTRFLLYLFNFSVIRPKHYQTAGNFVVGEPLRSIESAQPGTF
jgi:hypothetical protein